MESPPDRLVLRNLNVPARLAIAAFLVSVGVGYFSALVQLHFQHASPGKLLPEPNDAADTYYGRTGMSQLERLLVVDEGKPFNGSGSMRQTFTTKSAPAGRVHQPPRQGEEDWPPAGRGGAPQRGRR